MGEACKEHPEVDVSYFCFDCNAPPICSECVIHGSHRGHNVSLLKKAYPQIVNAMEDLTEQVGKKIDNLDLQDKRFEARKRELVEQNHAAKQVMANAFEDLRKRIDQKERELMKQCDLKAQECIDELDGSTRLILGRIEHLAEAVETVKRSIES